MHNSKKKRTFAREMKEENYFRSVLLFLLIGTVTIVRADDGINLQQVYETGLKVIEIETVNGEMPVFDGALPPQGVSGYAIKNATKVPARLKIVKDKQILYDSGDYLEDVSGITIRIRGNTTAWAKKKPYKIKLQKKADLLQRGDNNKYSDKDWLLILDESLNAKTGFKLNELCGMQWTPAYEYANVIFNGKYIGLYMLCESVKRNRNCRLNVDKTGFVFEYDAYWWNEKIYVESILNRHPMHYTFKYPDDDDLTEERISYFTDIIHKVESSINDSTYVDFIDENTFVTWILAHDILGNKDAGGSNYYLTKYDNSDNTKVSFALLWDFDMIFECRDQWSSVHGYRWFYFDQLLQNKGFIKAYVAKWKELSPTIFDQLFSYLEAYAASAEAPAFDASVELDNQLWNQDRRTASERTQGIISWLTRRKAWMDRAVETMSESVSGIQTITAHPHADSIIYNLQGQRVAKPQKGIYICNGKKFVAK